MKLNMAAPNPRGKLEWCDQEEDAAWNDVQPRQERMGGETPIHPSQLLRPLQHKRVVAMKHLHEPLAHGVGTRDEIGSEDASADGRADPDHYQ